MRDGDDSDSAGQGHKINLEICDPDRKSTRKRLGRRRWARGGVTCTPSSSPPARSSGPKLRPAGRRARGPGVGGGGGGGTRSVRGARAPSRSPKPSICHRVPVLHHVPCYITPPVGSTCRRADPTRRRHVPLCCTSLCAALRGQGSRGARFTPSAAAAGEGEETDGQR